MTRKLFAFDIDGTLLNSQKQPLDSTREALAELRRQGHLVLVATGRSRYLAQNVIRDLGFTNYIICNGAGAFLDHQQIYKHLLDQEALERLVQFMSEKEIGTSFVGLDESRSYQIFNPTEMEAAMNSFGSTTPELAPDYLKNGEIYQALAFYETARDGEFDALFPEFRFVRWHPYSVDIVPKTGSKAQTIAYMAERLGIAPADVIAFGDGNNDKEMLKAAGVGVAMGNADDDVQAVADLVTATNDDDGIAKALKTLALL
ncbi:HAD family hydrolase [Enterococcus sp. LJL90]